MENREGRKESSRPFFVLVQVKGEDVPAPDQLTGLRPAAPAAEAAYKATERLIPDMVGLMRRDAPTYLLEPSASREDSNPVFNYLRKTESRLGRAGHAIHARTYLAEGGWAAELTAKGGVLENMVEGFYNDLVINKNPKTRMVLRLVSDGGQAGEKENLATGFIRQELLRRMAGGDKARAEDAIKDIMEKKVRIIRFRIDKAEHLNSMLGLFADMGLAECDRYGKPGEYEPYSQEKPVPPDLGEKVKRLLALSTANFDDLAKTGASIEEILKAIFGGFELMARAIDWNALREMKEAWDKVLAAV